MGRPVCLQLRKCRVHPGSYAWGHKRSYHGVGEYPFGASCKGDGDRAIEVTVIHNHVLDDKPLYFMHFSTNDDAKKLASSSRGG